MIQSMTGFGRSDFSVAGRSFDIEIRSVNHRHLDVRARLPRALADYEQRVKGWVQARLGRGKVDVSVNPTDAGASEAELVVDERVATQYVEAARRLSDAHQMKSDLDVASLMAMPGVARFVEAGLPADQVEETMAGGFGRALDALVAMRGEEGARLAAEIEGRLGTVLTLVEFFESRSQEVLQAATERLQKRTEQIRQDTGLLDEARLHQEIVIAADRLDITEELVRLRSHVDQFRDILSGRSEEGPVGRRLDFLLQELGREANTVGSKANDAPLAHSVVELKTELERIREQVQNVE